MTIHEIPVHAKTLPIPEIETSEIEEVQDEFTNPVNWRTNLTMAAIVIVIVAIIYAFASYSSKPVVKPTQKTAIEILTDNNISAMKQIGLLSEQKKELVIQKNSLDEQIKRKDSAIQVYSAKIDSNAKSIADLTTNSN